MPSFVDMEIEVLRATARDKPALQRLMQFYLYDFSEFLNLEMDEHGSFHWKKFLDLLFSPAMKPGRHTSSR